MADDSDSERQNARLHINQPYDESLEVGDGEEVASIYTPSPSTHRGLDLGDRGGPRSRGNTPPDSAMDGANSEDEFDTGQDPVQRRDPSLHGAPSFEDEDDSEDDSQHIVQAQINRAPPTGGQVAALPGGGSAGGKKMYNEEEDEDDDSDESEEDDDEDDEGSNNAVEGAYDPADYEHLPVTPEIKELFQYITRYTPQTIELEHKLKPFIPDFIPAVGDIDAFIKVPRPDGKPDYLGLNVLDEPCAKQSDPTVLDLQLRAISKQTNLKAVVVKSIENAEKNPKAIDNWIQSITEIHKSRPPPNVHYTKNMPDIDTLMQEWPSEFEEMLKEISLPSADMDCDLPQYIDMICAILDIPVHKNRVQSLHLLFSVYSEFKNSQHFRSLADENKLDNNLKGQNGLDDEEDRLIL